MTNHPNRSRVLIRKTNHSPSVTTPWIRRTAVDWLGIQHVQDTIDQCASQVGSAACAEAYAELHRLERAYIKSALDEMRRA